MNDPVEQFKGAMRSADLTPPDTITGDGKIHRVSTNGKRSDTTGWYVLHLDGIPGWAFGDWRQGKEFTRTWCAKADKDMTQEQLQANRRRHQAAIAQRDAEKAQEQQSAAARAQKRWNAATPCTQHEYLSCKGIEPSGARIERDKLLIALRDTAGTMHSLQTIAPDGAKRFMPGGRVNGCYFGIGERGDALIVCEGFATGASLYACTGQPVAVAFDAGNLKKVALALRAEYPALKITIAADDDHQTSGNPGLTQATAAAQAVGGFLAVPEFPAGRGVKHTDFNDLHQSVGADAVKTCIEAARALTAPTAPADDAQWPEPISLPNALPAVEPFDAGLLPTALRLWVMDIAHRMQCPADFPAVTALVALSSLIGARAVIQPKAQDDWQVVPNLWGAVVGRPGVKKSPALSEALKPLHRLQAKAFELHKAAHGEWALDCKVTAMQDEANEKKAKAHAAKGDTAAARALLEPTDTPAEPAARRYIVNDATVEKLGELLQQNEWGTLSYRDELYGLLTQLDKQGQEGSRSFYLTSYDGNQAYAFDRIMRGTVHIPRVCLAMIGGIQPGRIQEYVRGAVSGGGADDGLLQRFGMTVWPDVVGDFVHVDQWPDTLARQTAWAVFDRLAALQPANDTEPVVWRFTPDAQELFVEWLVPFEKELRGDAMHPAMVSHLAKYRKLIPALALVFALIDTPDTGNLIGAAELLLALTWGEYLRSHANRLYAAAVSPETTDAATLLTKIRGGKLTDADGVILDRFTPRQIAVKGWAGLGTPDAVRKAAELLTDYGWLRQIAVPTGAAGGRPSDRYGINPAALKGGAS